jgi:hypothetical protein
MQSFLQYGKLEERANAVAVVTHSCPSAIKSHCGSQLEAGTAEQT